MFGTSLRRSRAFSIGALIVMTAAGAIHWWTSPKLFEAQCRVRIPHDPAQGGQAAGLDKDLKLSQEILDSARAALRSQSVWRDGQDQPNQLASRLKFDVQASGNFDEILMTYTTPGQEIDTALQVVQATVTAWSRTLVQSTSADGVQDDTGASGRILEVLAAQRDVVSKLKSSAEGLPADDAAHESLKHESESLQSSIAEAQIDRDEAERMRDLIRQAVDGGIALPIAAGKLTDHHMRSRALALVRRGQLETEWNKSRVQLAKFESIYGDGHPRMAALRATIGTLEEELGETALPTNGPPVEERLLAMVAQHFQEREEALGNLEQRQKDAAERLARSDDHRSALKTAQDKLAELEREQAQFDERQQHSKLAPPQVEVLSPPLLSDEPVSPVLWQEVGLGLASGLIVCFMFSRRKSAATVA